MDDAQELVGSLAQHVENELERTGGTLDYYRTLPGTANLLLPPVAPGRRPAIFPAPAARSPSANPVRCAASASRARPPPCRSLCPPPLPPRRRRPQAPPTSPQDWLTSVFAVQQVNRIDGMFVVDATGHVLASLPPSVHDRPAPDLADAPWRGRRRTRRRGRHRSTARATPSRRSTRVRRTGGWSSAWSPPCATRAARTSWATSARTSSSNAWAGGSRPSEHGAVSRTPASRSSTPRAARCSPRTWSRAPPDAPAVTPRSAARLPARPAGHRGVRRHAAHLRRGPAHGLDRRHGPPGGHAAAARARPVAADVFPWWAGWWSARCSPPG